MELDHSKIRLLVEKNSFVAKLVMVDIQFSIETTQGWQSVESFVW
jgi:hypothetical protein